MWTLLCIITRVRSCKYLEFNWKTDHIVTNHGVEGQSKNVTYGFRGNGFFSGSQTTIRRRSTRKIHYNQIEGGLAHCSIYDGNNNLLILNESVLNGEAYKLIRFGEHIFLEPIRKHKLCSICYRYATKQIVKNSAVDISTVTEFIRSVIMNYFFSIIKLIYI